MPFRRRGARVVLVIVCLAMLAAGAFVGAILQKRYGIGNLLRAAGIPYPATVPPPPPLRVEVAEEDRGRLSLFVLAGQSNMTGLAPVPQDQPRDSRVYLFGNDYHWREAVEPADDPHMQVDAVSADRQVGLGPSLAFAMALRRLAPQLRVGLVPCAKNASGILEWQRSLSDRSLYGSCLKRVRAASAMGQVAGILFFQGENEAEQNPRVWADPADWGRLFSRMVADWRDDLNDPELPVVFAQIGAIGPLGYPHLDTVKAQQRAVALPRVAMIRTDDLALADGVHFTAESYRSIGERFAQAYWELQ